MVAVVKSTDIACFMSSPGFTSKNRSFETVARRGRKRPAGSGFS
jgi:hypothetical protein